jgi:uncharacterized low-complexity protein
MQITLIHHLKTRNFLIPPMSECVAIPQGRGKRPLTGVETPSKKPEWRSNQMSDKSTIKPLAIAVGAALATSLASTTVVNAAENPFAMSELSSGYMVADAAEGKCGEGKCGGDKKAAEEGKCGEGKCGGDKKAAEEGAAKTTEEGKCGGDKKAAGEGKCGGDKK